MIRVSLPVHLRTLARIGSEVKLKVSDGVSLTGVLDKLEEEFPMLCGTIRNRQTKKRRDMVRFFACGEDISHEPLDKPLPKAVVQGEEPLLIIGAIAGG